MLIVTRIYLTIHTIHTIGLTSTQHPPTIKHLNFSDYKNKTSHMIDIQLVF